YGGLRAAKVARALQQDQGIIIAGIVMVSPLIDGALVFGADRFALGAALQLPSLAATELERRGALKLDAVAAAEQFAMTEYLTTLAGRPPQGDAARAFYGKVADMTGMPVDTVEKQRGFIRRAYVKRLREAKGEIVSSYDASFASADPFSDTDGRDGEDPVLDGFTRALGGAFVGYARDELGFKTDITYNLLAHDVNRKWDWHSDGGTRSLPSASGDLRELLSVTPSFKLLVAHGYSDLVTPYAASRYVLDHLPPIGASGRVALKLYPGGHMLYLNPSSRSALTADARAFYGVTLE
ncbi:MAG TPA: carboxypeptidase, partial [Xanthobacteraceae bacterium]|nr:carboxypeptidase [Xanthobacteraceae bacterium]